MIERVLVLDANILIRDVLGTKVRDFLMPDNSILSETKYLKIKRASKANL
ncbi:Uncharacterised protein [Legionella oakridgensis]|nr:conserved hypothetical protein [Legionella longbeachae D-4968]VEE00963.1 Uncharacterised protein [Legionella oakridgensis]